MWFCRRQPWRLESNSDTTWARTDWLWNGSRLRRWNDHATKHQKVAADSCLQKWGKLLPGPVQNFGRIKNGFLHFRWLPPMLRPSTRCYLCPICRIFSSASPPSGWTRWMHLCPRTRATAKTPSPSWSIMWWRCTLCPGYSRLCKTPCQWPNAWKYSKCPNRPLKNNTLQTKSRTNKIREVFWKTNTNTNSKCKYFLAYQVFKKNE